MRLRSRQGMLAVAAVGVVSLVAVLMARDQQPGGAPPASARARTAAVPASAAVPVTGLKLELLQQRRPGLDAPERDPFRFQARPAPAPPPPSRSPGGAAAGTPARPAPPMQQGPPPPPPIPLRFIGFVDAPTQAGRIAILSDGRGNIFYGREGATIEGRYRVVKLSPDSVELAHVAGGARQTIRLSGQ